MWNSFVEWLTNITNNPVFISITTVVSALGAVLIVLSKTSVGRKALNMLKENSRLDNLKITEMKTEIEKHKGNIENFIEQKNEEITLFKQELLNKSTVMYNQLDSFEDSIFKILEVIPNQKVQGMLEEMKSNWKEQKKVIAETMGHSYTEIDEKFNELKKELDALKEGMKHEERVNNETEEE